MVKFDRLPLEFGGRRVGAFGLISNLIRNNDHIFS